MVLLAVLITFQHSSLIYTCWAKLCSNSCSILATINCWYWSLSLLIGFTLKSNETAIVHQRTNLPSRIDPALNVADHGMAFSDMHASVPLRYDQEHTADTDGDDSTDTGNGSEDDHNDNEMDEESNYESYESISHDDSSQRDEEDEEWRAAKAHDFHAMLSFALKSFVNLQETGFVWDLAIYNKLYEKSCMQYCL